MSENIDNIGHANVTVGDVKCRSEINSTPSGEIGNPSSNQNLGGNDVGGEIEHQERKKKTRRRKSKRKNPYNKQNNDSRGQKVRQLTGKRLYAQKQPEAPYNSNRFLIEDHNDLKDFDVKLLAVSAANRSGDNNEASISGLDPPRQARVRDPSFTSADSDDDYFYSSPEDEEEFLTKEFSNTYQDLHVESLTQMSKGELIQQVLQLEEKVDALEKRLAAKSRPEKCKEHDSGGEMGLVDKLVKFQEEISQLVLANEELQHENEKLRRQRKSSVSSVDSESDSSSSSGSSEMTDSDGRCSPQCEVKNGPHSHMNGDIGVENDLNVMDTDSAR